MAAKDALSNVALKTRRSEAERKRNEAEWEERHRQGIRETALEMALKMAPGDVRTAEALMNDATKLTEFMLTGKRPKAR